METPTNFQLEELRRTPFACIRHDVKYYPYFDQVDIMREGLWYKKNDYIGKHVDWYKNLMATDRFEFRGDGQWAQVYLIVEIP